MERILFVLDSCRAGSSVMGPGGLGWLSCPERVLTHTNRTLTAFVDYVDCDRLPGRFRRKRVNHVKELVRSGVSCALYTDNPHLHPVIDTVGRIASRFTDYALLGQDYSRSDAILSRVREFISGHDDYYVIAWLGDTHQPYCIDGEPFREYLDWVECVAGFNRGEYPVPGGADLSMTERVRMWELFLGHVKARQGQCYRSLIGKIRSTLGELPGPEPEVIITADHGESLGEHHLFGHGLSLDLPQFEVPLVTNLP